MFFALLGVIALFAPTVVTMAWVIARKPQGPGTADPAEAWTRGLSRDLERQLSRNEFIELPGAGA